MVHRTGDRVRLRVERIDAQGVGEAWLDETPVHVEDGLVSETGEVLLSYVGTHRAYGRMLRRDEDSEYRVAPECTRWTPASPCRLMHLEAGAQLEFKRRKVAHALFERDLRTQVRPTLAPSEPLGWRAKATYVIAMHEGEILLGAYRRGSHVVQSMGCCPLEEDAVSRTKMAIQQVLNASGVPAADPELAVAQDPGCGSPQHVEGAEDLARDARGMRAEPLVEEGARYVIVRSNHREETMAVLLGPTGVPGVDGEFLDQVKQRYPKLQGLWVGVSGEGDALFGGPLQAVGDARPIVEQLGDLQFEVSPRSFFQVNRASAAALHALVAEALGNGTVVDAYCGVGTISLAAAYAGATVIGIESVAAAVHDAQKNAERNGLAERARFLCSDVALGLRQLHREGTRPDAIVLNPPRRGCAADALSAACSLGPETIVYVSCSPNSLAIDLRRLKERGYHIKRVQPVDLFPHSEHVETIAVLGPST